MRINRSYLNQILLKSLSAFFVVWLSGILVLVGCSSRGLSSLAISPVHEESESCLIEKGHDCCDHKLERDDDLPKVSENENELVDCCSFKPQKTLSADLSNSKNINQFADLTEKIDAPKPIYLIKQFPKISQIYHSNLRSRGRTYLRNCIFLI